MTGATIIGPDDHLAIQQCILRAPSRKEREVLDAAVTDFIVSTMSSHVLVDKPEFRKLVSALRLGYECPSSKTIGRRILELYTLMMPVIKTHFEKLPCKYSIAIDGWTNTLLKGYWIVVMHWTDTSTRKLKSAVLHICHPDPGTGLGDRVGHEVFQFLQSMGGCALEKLQAVVSDNGSDALRAAKKLRILINKELERESLKLSYLIRCTDHTIQLAVKAALTFIDPANEKLRTLLKMIRGAKARRQAYRKEAQVRHYLSLEPPPIDTPTRWNSTHEMDRRAIKRRAALDATASTIDELHAFQLTAADWKQIEKIINFLQPARDIMEAAAADQHVTVSMVASQIALIMDHCLEVLDGEDEEGDEEGREEQDDFLHGAARAMSNKLSGYEATLLSEPTLIGTFLDPRFPKPSSLSSHQSDTGGCSGSGSTSLLSSPSAAPVVSSTSDGGRVAISKERIREILRLEYNYPPAAVVTSTTSPQVVVNKGQPGSQNQKHIRAMIFRTAAAGMRKKNKQVVSAGNLQEVDEVDRFYVMLVPPETNLIEWWHSQRTNFPHLFKLAMDVLSIPSSSTSAERANSEAGREFSKYRLSLSDNMFRSSMCVRSWMKAGFIPPENRESAIAHLNAELKEAMEDLLQDENVM